MENEKLLTAFVIFVVTVAFFNALITVTKLSKVSHEITGFANNAQGFVNLTISTQIAISATQDTINFGSGTINTTGGYSRCNLTTAQTSAYKTPTECGNWTVAGVEGLVVENIGTVPCKLNISSKQGNAVNFLGGSNPFYQINVTNKEDGACDGDPAGVYNLSMWHDVNWDTDNGESAQFCDVFNYTSDNDEIYIDVHLSFDETAAGVKSDTLTFDAYQ